MMRQTGRSVTPRRSVTPACRGRAGVRPVAHLEEEISQQVEAVREHELDSSRTDLPQSRFAVGVQVRGGELIELARLRGLSTAWPIHAAGKGRVAWPRFSGILDGGFSHVVRVVCPRSSGMAPSMPGERPFWLSPVKGSTSFSVMIPCTRSSLRLDNYDEVEILVVARRMRGAEGMGAATVGPGHRNTTYTGVRGPEQPKGKGRRRARPITCTGTGTRPDAPHGTPGFDPEVRDATGLTGVKSTNSPDIGWSTPNSTRSRRRDRRSYSPIIGGSDGAPPQSTRRLD